MTTKSLILASCIGLVLIVAGCSERGSNTTTDRQLAAEVASFDLNTERAGRFTVGLFAVDRSEVALGEIEVSFDYLVSLDGTVVDGDPTASPSSTTATFLALPGSDISVGTDATFSPPPGVRGVYGTEPIAFSAPGAWEVTVTADVDGEVLTATAAFEVRTESLVPGPGDSAPRTDQPLPGNPGIAPRAIDSRLSFDDQLADPALHEMTIADAIREGRPQLIVVATPVFCVSRFCGPITDEVARLQRLYSSDAEFVHLEVWEDFESSALNDAALEWIAPLDVAEAAEPWVFLVDGTGTITHRWDNVASTAELVAALEELGNN